MGVRLGMVHRDGSADRRTAFDLIGRRVVRMLDDRGVSQTEVSRRSGISMSQLQAVVRGTAIPLMVLVKIAGVLEVTIDELIPQEARA